MIQVKQKRYVGFAALCLMASAFVSFAEAEPPVRLEQHVLTGKWITELDGRFMLDPQTSGLKYHAGYLYSLSDGSSHESQRRRLHKISKDSAKVVQKFGPTVFSQTVQQSCFYPYLSNRPDYEALVPLDPTGTQWLYVTEDASQGIQLTPQCQQKYEDTHSTTYPTLLVKLELSEESLTVTAVRPVQFPKSAQVGDSPNDGIEGLALTKDNTLLLGLEKDASGQPKVFSTALTNDFWDTQAFINVIDTQLSLPTFTSGNHPINGMDIYYPDDSSQGYLIAAARNDEELWIVDLSKQKPTKIIPLLFLAPSIANALSDAQKQSAYCAPLHQMDNASLEGLAVVDQHIYMVNDPWKTNYKKNIVCDADTSKYEEFSHLLFKLEINPRWFK